MRNLTSLLMLLTCWGVFPWAGQVRAQFYEKVFDFTEARAADLANRGSIPYSSLVLGRDGQLYGTTSFGGANDFGTVFKVTPDGELTTLVEFAGNQAVNKGIQPFAGLVQGNTGEFYGATISNGSTGSGTVFKMTAEGKLTTLWEFPGDEGRTPFTALVQGRDGQFYGTTQEDGTNNYGTVYKMTPDGVVSTLVHFTGYTGAKKGVRPSASLIEGSDGNFYGTTEEGGTIGFGTVFRVTPAGGFTTLVEFTDNGVANKGGLPSAALVQGADGEFYGTTMQGGANSFGTVFRMTPAGALTTLVDFTGNGASNKGSRPRGALVQGRDGDFYGTTHEGGASNLGTVFKVTPAGVLTTLVEFTGSHGSNPGSRPLGALVQGSEGHFFGTTSEGGASNLGTVFKMTTAGVMTTLVEFTGKGVSDKGSLFYAPLLQGSDGNFYGTSSHEITNTPGTVLKMTPAGKVVTLLEFESEEMSTLGRNPRGGLVEGGDGNFYGTTEYGGSDGYGSIFKVTPQGVRTTLVEFSLWEAMNRGSNPHAGLIRGSDGNFYGTTFRGGEDTIGTVFRMTPEGSLTTLVEFSGEGAANNGRRPYAGVIEGSDGNFYGTTEAGGVNIHGTVFKVTPDGALTILVEFSGNGAANKGRLPLGALVEGSDGNFYGTTAEGGGNDLGTVFKMTTDGELTTLVEFTGNGPANKGRRPSAGLVLAGDGNFYGTTFGGGAGDMGTIFRMTPEGGLTTIWEFLSTADGGFPLADLIVAADGNLYGTTGGPTGTDGTIYRLILPGAPTVVVSKIASRGSAGAAVEAQVNARGAIASVLLEYGEDDAVFPNIVPMATGLAGYQTKFVGAFLGGLSPGTTYFYRLRAVSSAGSTMTPVASFSTLVEPEVSAGAASEVAPTSARFNGTVNARNFESTAVFEWGTDGNSFPNSAPAAPGTVTGNAATAVSAAVAGLPEGGTVFYRLRATNQAGTVISGVRSFSTVSVTTSNPLPEQVGVAEAIFRATINTFGRTAVVKFRYWVTSTPESIFETATQSVTSNGPVEVTHREPTLLENVNYSYQVSVELAGTETNGGPVTFTTDSNEAPIALPDRAFYAGQVEIKPLENDSDPNSGSNAGLLLASTLVSGPNAALGVAAVSADRVTISYSPQFNVRADDALTYRVVDAHGATADAQVRLIAFSQRAGLYGGRITFGSGASAREGQVAVQMGTSGLISTSFMAWPNSGEGLRESFVLKGEFDQQGRLARTLNSPSGAVLALTLQLDADAPQILGTFEERVNNVSTTGEIAFVLTRNAGTGGLAESGLRTGFLSPPPELAGVMSEGFVRMTIGKDARRGARFAGRLPDGEPFLVSAKAQGRTYEVTRKLEQGGLFTGLVRAIDASGMMGNLYWQKRPSGRARFHRGGVESMLSLSGTAYPVIAKGELPPLGFGSTSSKARLRLSGGDFNGTYRDLLLNLLPGAVQIIGPDNLQPGDGLKTLSTSKMTIKFDAPQAKFTGKFLHPETGRPVTFEGAFRSAFDNEPGQGRGVFRGPSAAGAVRIEGE